MTAPIYIPSNHVGGFPFLHILSSVCFFLLLFFVFVFLMIAVLTDMRYSVISHCGNFHFLDDWWCWASFHVLVIYLSVCFGKLCVQVFCSFLKQIFFFLCWIAWVVFVFWALTPNLSYHLQVFSPIRGYCFYFVDGFLCWAKNFKFN